MRCCCSSPPRTARRHQLLLGASEFCHVVERDMQLTHSGGAQATGLRCSFCTVSCSTSRRSVRGGRRRRIHLFGRSRCLFRRRSSPYRRFCMLARSLDLLVSFSFTVPLRHLDHRIKVLPITETLVGDERLRVKCGACALISLRPYHNRVHAGLSIACFKIHPSPHSYSSESMSERVRKFRVAAAQVETSMLIFMVIGSSALYAHLAYHRAAFHDACANLPRILAAIEEAANNGARLVVFSGNAFGMASLDAQYVDLKHSHIC